MKIELVDVKSMARDVSRALDDSLASSLDILGATHETPISLLQVLGNWLNGKNPGMGAIVTSLMTLDMDRLDVLSLIKGHLDREKFYRISDFIDEYITSLVAANPGLEPFRNTISMRVALALASDNPKDWQPILDGAVPSINFIQFLKSRKSLVLDHKVVKTLIASSI